MLRLKNTYVILITFSVGVLIWPTMASAGTFLSSQIPKCIENATAGRSTLTSSPSLSPAVLKDIDTKSQQEYDKVYKQQIKDGHSAFIASDQAGNARDAKRKELITAACTKAATSGGSTGGSGGSSGGSGGNSGGSGGDTSGGATGGTGGTTGGTASTDINTDVGVSNSTNFDTVLGTLFNPLDFNRPENLVIRIINALLLLAAMIATIMIIVGGINMVASGGSEAQITKGRKTITWAVIGLVVCLLSFSIVAIVQSIIT